MTARILVVAPDLPHPPFTGAHTRPLSLIRALARRHEVVVVGAAAPGAELAPLEDVCLAVRRLQAEPYRRGPARTALAGARRLLSPVPLIGRSESAALAHLVDDAVREYRPDAIQVETMYAVHYRRDGLPSVADLTDVVSGLCEAAVAAHPWRYAAAYPQALRAEHIERTSLAAFDAVLTMNDADAGRLRRLGLVPDVVPLSMPVPDEADLAPSGDGRSPGDGQAPPSGGPLRALFVAAFEHVPNRRAARFITEELRPALQRRGTAAEIVVAGRNADGLRLAATPANGGAAIRVVSDPPDLGPLYRAADIVIVPLAFGGGTKNKTLEAMAWSRPVVGTPQAFTGLPTDLHGRAYLEVPLSGEAIADALARLADDAALRASIGAAGRRYVLEHHTQEQVDDAVDAVYARVLK